MRKRKVEKSQVDERVADREKIRRREKSSEAPVEQRNCKRPWERSVEFEAEKSLKLHLDEPRSHGYVRARVETFDMFSSSSAPRRQTEISTKVT